MAGANANEQNLKDQSAWERWQGWQSKNPKLTIILVILVIFLVSILINFFLWALFPKTAPTWTGFGPAPSPYFSEELPAKSLWDWLGLLIIPLFLALGAAVLGRTQQNREMRARKFEQMMAKEARQHEWEIEMDRQEQVLVDQYYARMTGYLLNHGLRSSAKDDEIRNIARASTLGVLRGINTTRESQVLQFLYEAHLINTPEPIINLEGADLTGVTLESADLRKAHLAATDMHDAKLNRANLAGADLSQTNLINAELRGAGLEKARLPDAYLSGAHMREAVLKSAVLTNVLLNNAKLMQADLRGADLSGANLVGADLSQARLQGANFSDAKVKPAKIGDGDTETILKIKDATYDDTTTWPEDFDPAAQDAVATK